MLPCACFVAACMYKCYKYCQSVIMILLCHLCNSHFPLLFNFFMLKPCGSPNLILNCIALVCCCDGQMRQKAAMFAVVMFWLTVTSINSAFGAAAVGNGRQRPPMWGAPSRMKDPRELTTNRFYGLSMQEPAVMGHSSTNQRPITFMAGDDISNVQWNSMPLRQYDNQQQWNSNLFPSANIPSNVKQVPIAENDMRPWHSRTQPGITRGAAAWDFGPVPGVSSPHFGGFYRASLRDSSVVSANTPSWMYDQAQSRGRARSAFGEMGGFGPVPIGHSGQGVSSGPSSISVRESYPDPAQGFPQTRYPHINLVCITLHSMCTCLW